MFNTTVDWFVPSGAFRWFPGGGLQGETSTPDLPEESTSTPAQVPHALSARLIIYIVIGSAGVLTNSMVIAVMMASRTLRAKIMNMFIINQSVIDFFGSLFLVATSTNSYESGGHVGLAGEFHCRVWEMKVPMWSMFMSSTYNLVAITVERYLQVIHPIKHKTSFGRREAFAMMVAAWLIGPMYNFPLTSLTSGINPADGTCLHMTEWPSETARSLCGVLTFVLEFFLPLFILVFCYGRMVARIRRRIVPEKVMASGSLTAGVDGQGGGPDPVKLNTHRQETMGRMSRTIMRTLILLSLGFVLCWIWNQVFFLLFNTGYSIEYGSPFYHFTVYAAFLNCCMNPVIYMVQYHPFREELVKTGRACCRAASSRF